MTTPATATAVMPGEYFQSATKTVSSPGKFAKPGRPMLAMMPATKNAASTGVFCASPPISDMSKLCVRWCTLVASRNSSATDRPCATISSTTPPVPMVERQAMPRKQ